MFGLRFIKAQPTTYLMKYRGGAVTQQGAGLSGFYYGPVTSLVAVPIGSRDAAFIFQQIARDFQALTVQGHVTYRISEPQRPPRCSTSPSRRTARPMSPTTPKSCRKGFWRPSRCWRSRPSRN